MKVAVSSVAIAIKDALDPLRETIPGAITGTFGKILKDLEDILVGAIRQSDETAKLLEKTRLGLEDETRFRGKDAVAHAGRMPSRRDEEGDHATERVKDVISALNHLSDALDQLMRSGIVFSPRAERPMIMRPDDGGPEGGRARGEDIAAVPGVPAEGSSRGIADGSLMKSRDQGTSIPSRPTGDLDKQVPFEVGSGEKPSGLPPVTGVGERAEAKSSSTEKLILPSERSVQDGPLGTPHTSLVKSRGHLGGSPPAALGPPHPTPKTGTVKDQEGLWARIKRALGLGR